MTFHITVRAGRDWQRKSERSCAGLDKSPAAGGVARDDASTARFAARAGAPPRRDSTPGGQHPPPPERNFEAALLSPLFFPGLYAYFANDPPVALEVDMYESSRVAHLHGWEGGSARQRGECDTGRVSPRRHSHAGFVEYGFGGLKGEAVINQKRKCARPRHSAAPCRSGGEQDRRTCAFHEG